MKLTLNKPIKRGDDEIFEIELREPNTGDIMECGYPLTIGDGVATPNADVVGRLISRLANIPPSTVKQMAVAAAIRKKVTPHSLRKFYVQRLIDQGLDVRSVMELSRHSSLASLHHYLVVNEEAARAAVELIR